MAITPRPLLTGLEFAKPHTAPILFLTINGCFQGRVMISHSDKRAVLPTSATIYRPVVEFSHQKPISSYLWVPYFAVYIFCAIFFQVRSGLDPWDEASPIEDFTRPLLWLLSVLSLLIADCYRLNHWRSWAWLLGSAAIALMALDETFQFHERSEQFTGDDDHMKFAEWVLAGIGVYIIHLISVPCKYARRALVIGFVFHTCYILVDVGDGDYYRLPFGTITELRWVEEYLELVALLSYSLGILSLHLATRARPAQHSRASPPG